MEKIRMLRDVGRPPSIPGTVNGVDMGPYAKGREYVVGDGEGEIPLERAQLFVGSVMAEEVLLPPPPPEPPAAEVAPDEPAAPDDAGGTE